MSATVGVEITQVEDIAIDTDPEGNREDEVGRARAMKGPCTEVHLTMGWTRTKEGLCKDHNLNQQRLATI